jgi:O-antigen/teichoic acid export membrane protein
MESTHVSEQQAAEPAVLERAPTAAGLVRGVSWKALSVIVGQGLWWASLFVLAILVPPKDFGIIAVGTTVVGATTLLIESGTGGALIIARELDARSVRASVVRTGVAGLIFAAAFFVLAGPIANAFADGADPSPLRALAPTAALIGFFVVPNALLTKYLEFKRIAIVSMVAAAIASAAAILAAALGAEVWALVTRLVIYQVLLTGLTWVAASGLFPKGDEKGVRAPRPEGATAFLLIAISNTVAWSFDTLVVGANVSTTQLGLYAFAFALAFLPLRQISFVIGGVLLPAIAAARDREAIPRQALKALRMMALMLMPLVPVGVVLAPGVIPTVLGNEWKGMVTPFQILLVVGVGLGINNVLGEVYAGAGGETLYRRARTDLPWALITLVAIAVGVNLDGIDGAALAHIFSLAVLAFAYVFWAGRSLGIGGPSVLAELRGVTVCVSVQALVTAAVALGAEAAGASTLAAGLIAAPAGVLALLLTLRALQPELMRESRELIATAVRRRVS